MHGLIGSFKVVPGRHGALMAAMLEGMGSGMPGCLAYVVAEDPKDVDTAWITEVWDIPVSRGASLVIPAMKNTIARVRPLIAGFGEYIKTRPLGDLGVPAGR